jgi:hypothetical protein
MQQQQQLQQQQSNLNPFPKLPPINGGSGGGGGSSNGFYQNFPNNVELSMQPHPYAQPLPPHAERVNLHAATNVSSDVDSTWPSTPVHLNGHEESSLQADLASKLAYCTSEQLKSFYNELTTYDPSMSGFVHHSNVSMAAAKNSVRFIMRSDYVIHSS